MIEFKSGRPGSLFSGFEDGGKDRVPQTCGAAKTAVEEQDLAL
jgi:hypothetical protein